MFPSHDPCEWVEETVGKSLITQTRRVTFEAFHIPENNTVNIPYGPLISVESVKYYDSADVLQTLATSAYTVDVYGNRLKFDDLPDIEDRPNAVEINYTAGFGAASTDVPTPLIQAVKYLAAQMFENRLPVIVGTSAQEMPLTAQYLISRYSPVLK